MTDYLALFGHPRMHVLLIGLKPWPGCILILKQFDREDFQLFLQGLFRSLRCRPSAGGFPPGDGEPLEKPGAERARGAIGQPTPGTPQVPPSRGSLRRCW